jgi:basic membrane lipoprotein Med (substrate-binding protein (PBP1-ABC) superfamily)
VAVGLLACGAPEDPVGTDAFRVALLTPGSVRDAGWNQSAYEGLVAIRDQLGAEIAYQETRTPQDFEAGFRDFAARGFDLVFGHGFEFQDAAAKVGAEFPEAVFITTSGSTLRANVAPVVFELEQATYVLGYLGARVSRTGRLGAVGGVEIPSVASTFLAFAAGARAARPDVQVVTSYLGSWEDVAAGREATLALISSGADVLIHNADAAGRGFFQAAQEQTGVYVFGTNRNQNDLAPEVVLASAVLDIPLALLRVAREVEEGRFEARSIRFGLGDGVVSIAWNDRLRARLPSALRTEVDTLVKRIESGDLVVPRGGF